MRLLMMGEILPSHEIAKNCIPKLEKHDF